MPLVNVRVIENVFTPEEKGQMLKGITEALIGVEGENVREFTVVVLEAVRGGDYAVGGQLVSTADARALRAVLSRAKPVV